MCPDVYVDSCYKWNLFWFTTTVKNLPYSTLEELYLVNSSLRGKKTKETTVLLLCFHINRTLCLTRVRRPNGRNAERLDWQLYRTAKRWLAIWHCVRPHTAIFSGRHSNRSALRPWPTARTNVDTTHVLFHWPDPVWPVLFSPTGQACMHSLSPHQNGQTGRVAAGLLIRTHFPRFSYLHKWRFMKRCAR